MSRTDGRAAGPHDDRATRSRVAARGRRASGAWLPLAIALAFAGGCRQDMHDAPRLDPLEASTFFADGRASRPLVSGTVARGHLREDDHLYTGRVDGDLVEDMPFSVDRQVLERGRERYGIYCAPCHDGLGTGEGLIVERGFRQPESFHTPRLRDMPVGHYYDAIANGFGLMPDYRDQIAVRDRWAIVAYIRALQLSQAATIDDVPAGERPGLTAVGSGSTQP